VLTATVIPGEFFRDSIPSLHEDPFIPTQLRVSTYHTLTTLLPLDNLTYLDVSYNDWLTEIPREILGCTALKKLDLSGCRNLIVGRLPGCVAELTSLEWLAADGCDLISIGSRILNPINA
jgi:Leucine-rich repeat (LRR) protein